MNPTTNARGGINRTSRREQEGLVSSGTTGTGATLATVPTTPNVIPVDRVVDNPVDGLSIPSAPADITPITDAVTASNSYLSEAQARADAEQTKYTAGQDMLRALNDQLGQRSADLNSYRDQAGLPEQEALLRKRLAQIRLKTDTIANRDNMSTLEQGALEGKGADSRLVGRQQNAISRDRMLARASEAIDLRTQIADADLIQGNIEGAMDQINAALDAKYTPIEQSLILEMQFLNNQKDFLTTAQREVADARLANFQEQLQVFKDARNAVNAAVASGGLQPGEAQQLMNLSPEEQMAAANEVIGRVANEDRQFDRYARQQSLNLQGAQLQLARDKFEAESSAFGSGTITLENGEKAVVSAEGTVTPISQIDFDDPAQIDALPVSDITKAVMGGYAKTKDLTPTDKSKVAAELAKIGFNPNTYIVNKLDALVQTWASVDDNSKGYFEGLKFWESKTNSDVATFESQRTLLTREIARLFDVGVLSDQDVQAYKDAMPSRQDSDLSVVLSKASGIAGAATGKNTQNVGKYVSLPDGRTAVVGLDGDTLLDPSTGQPIE